METPEGWPTDKMIWAGLASLNSDSAGINYDSVRAAFTAMLAADSIPLVLPAPEFQGVFDSEGSRVGEILQLETQLSDQDVKALHDYIARVTPPAQNYVKMPTTAEEAELMANLGMMWLEQNAPDRLKTPPAHEDEPAAEVRAMDGGEATIYYAEMLTKGYILPHGTKLYTRPSSELRKAAEEVATQFANLGNFSISYGLLTAIESLCAVLNKK